MGNSEFNSVWETCGYELVSTGGGFWAEIKIVQGIEFWVTDSQESGSPDPDEQLTVGAYRPNSGEHLEFTETADNLGEIERHLEEWAQQLQGKLNS